MKPLNSIQKRDLLAAKKYDADEVRAYAEDFFDQERFGDAYEFYRKLGDEEGVRKVKAACISAGEPEVLWRIENTFRRDLVTREDWAACGENAMKTEKFRSAAYAFLKSGDAERRAAAEKEFTAPATPPPAPAPPPSPQ